MVSFELGHRFRRLAVALLTILVGLGALWATWLGDHDTPDAASARRRTYNAALHAAAVPLPGTPALDRFAERLKVANHSLGAPVFIRIFKHEFELELWLDRGDRFELFATYPVCNWSGRLGPKLREGDHQAPEGFYSFDAQALNPNSRWHRSFNLGFPNAFDRAHGRTGTFLMVHGGCSSVGCFAMTDPAIDEIWHLVTSAFAAGQKLIHVHVFPFRMTPDALAAQRNHTSAGFWQSLQQGHDAFEATRKVPSINVCARRYELNAGCAG